MVYKKLLGSMLVLSLLATAPSALGIGSANLPGSTIEREKKEAEQRQKAAEKAAFWRKCSDAALHVLGTTALATAGITATASAGYAWYWMNGYDLRETLKLPFGLVALGAVIAVGIKYAAKEIGNTIEKKVVDAKKTVEETKESLLSWMPNFLRNRLFGPKKEVVKQTNINA